MLSLDGDNVRCCDGVTRREFLRIGGLGAAGLMLPQLLEMRANADSSGVIPFGRAKRCILLFMSGGPPQMDTWDLKPEAPLALRGEFAPIKTNVPGIEISNTFHCWPGWRTSTPSSAPSPTTAISTPSAPTRC